MKSYNITPIPEQLHSDCNLFCQHKESKAANPLLCAHIKLCVRLDNSKPISLQQINARFKK